MDLPATWRVVLSIDDADAFIERQSPHAVYNKSIISILPCVLEYYTDILFLTSNRVTTFDDAFRPHIQVPIRYTHLNLESRVKIWRNLLKRAPGGADVSENGIRVLARDGLNGRHINNVVNAAEGPAKFDGAKVGLEHLQQVTRMQAAFENDITHVGGVYYTAPDE